MSAFSGANAHRYSPGVLVGNWQDEVSQRDEKLKLYKSEKNYATQNAGRSAASPVAVAAQAQALAQATQLCPATEGGVPLGQPFMIANVKTGAALAVDLAPLSAPGPNQVVLRAVAGAGPQVRSTWELHRARDENNPGYNRVVRETDTLHYGQRVRLVNTGASQKGFLYVHSGLARGRYASEGQPATAAYGASADNVFVVTHRGLRRQDRDDGRAVPLGEPVVLLHAATNLPLCCGADLSVTCAYATDQFTFTRGGVAVAEENLWRISGGGGGPAGGAAALRARAAASRGESTTSGGASGTAPVNAAANAAAEEVVQRVRDGALAVGGRLGFRAVSLALRVAASEHRSRFIDRHQLQAFLARMGVAVLPLELDVLMRYFDTDGDNRVCVQEILTELRGNMCRPRLDAVIYAFQQLMVEGEGAVDYQDMHALYSENADYHPDVRDGFLTPEEVVSDFEASWPSDILGDKLGIVRLNEFVEYYNDISPATEDDERFFDMLRNCWAIPESRAYMRDAPHRSIAVRFKDGSSRTINLPDSLVADVSNPEEVRKLLVRFNIRDVEDFRVHTSRLPRANPDAPPQPPADQAPEGGAS